MFSLEFRDTLPPAVLDELESLTNKLKGFLSISFNEDGTLIASDASVAAVTVGVPIPWLSDVIPSGHLLLDGSQKNRVTYKTLFELWGTTHGIGDGSTTFNIPDMRGRGFIGKAASGTTAIAVGETGGSLDHTHSTPAGTSGATTPAISGSSAGATATISGSTAAEAAHTHAYSGTTGAGNGPNLGVDAGFTNSASRSDHDHNYSGTTGAGSSHSHGAGSLAADSHVHGAGTLAVASHTHTTPSGTSGTANAPYFVGNWIVFAGV